MKPLLVAAEVADVLGCTEDRVRRMAARGELPHRRDGRFLKFHPDDLAEYVESIKVPMTDYRRSNPRNRKTA